MKRIIAVTGMALAAVGLAAAPASADPKPNTNSTTYWEAYFEAAYPGSDYTCSKAEYPSGSTATSWEATQFYAAVLLKGGSVDSGYGAGVAVYENVSAGTVLSPPMNAGSQQAAISWLMTCTTEGGGGPYPY